MYTQNNDKKSIIRGVMKNDRLSSIIRDAYDSPIGSTKRAQAKKILSVMTKLNGGNSFDGQGGPSVAYQEPAPLQYKKLIVFPSAPKMMTPEERRMRAQMVQVNDGQGGLTTPNAPLPTPTTSGVTTPKTDIPVPQRTPSGYTAGDFGKAFSSGWKELGYPTSIPNPISAIGNFATRNIPGSAGYTAYHGAPKPVSSGGGGSWGPAPSASSPTPTQGTTPLGPSVPEGGSPASSTSPQNGSVLPPGATLEGSASYGGGTSPTGSYPGIQEAVNANVGGTGFAIGMMNDLEKLRKLPGFENVSEEDLPFGASLAKQVDYLDDTLRKEWKLDEILNQKNNMMNTFGKDGSNLTLDLTDYMTGRDEYLNQVNDMIEKAKGQMVSASDFADPKVKKSNEQYLNYLYLLKGRQSKTYTDFLDSSVKKYEADLNDVANHYDTALNAYQRELTSKTAISTEQYSMYYNALTDMYKAAEEAPKKKLEMDKMRLEMDKARSDMANDAIRAQLDWIKIMKGDPSNLPETFNKLQGLGMIDSEKRLNPAYTMADAEQLYSFGIPSDAVYQARVYAGTNAMTYADPKTGERAGVDTVAKIANTLLRDVDIIENQDPTQATLTPARKGEVLRIAQSALKENQSVLPPEQVTKLVEAGNFLEKGEKAWYNPFSSGRTMSEQKFLDQYKDSGVDKKFLGALFTNYQADPRSISGFLYNIDPVNKVKQGMKTPEEIRSLAIDMMVDKELGFGSQ